MKDLSQAPRLYFGYGSNLWLHQMELRCPESHYLGVALLPDYSWIINGRGYANVVAEDSTETTTTTSGSATSGVYGLIFSLSRSDEAALDINEGVPEAYTKSDLDVKFWPASDKGPVDIGVEKPQTIKALVYVDEKRITPSKPRAEYVVRMNNGIRDALKLGVPEEYVQKVMRKYIPELEDKNAQELAEKQALRFVDGREE